MDFTGADLIREINPATGAQLNSFPAMPLASPGFDVFFGDVEVSEATGNLFLVGSTQNRIRELTPTGAFVQDLDVGPLGVSGMSGIAFDDAKGEAWISSTNGTVYHLSGFDALAPPPPPGAIPEPGTVILLGTGLAGLLGYGWWQRRPRA